jgi:hypothetical protein
MDSHEIAAKFDERAGYELVSYADVAMPIFRIQASALVQGAITFSPIEEFILRLLDVGLTDGSEISGFLGLDAQVVDGVITSLIQNALVREDFDGSVTLTARGREDIAAQRPLRPTTETIAFYVDGLTRIAYWHSGFLNAPKDVKDLGLVEIRAIPVRNPTLEEIEVEDVDRAIQIALGSGDEKKVLRIREIFKVKRFFYDAIALIYKGIGKDDIQVAFAVDGRASEAHELAFAKGGGLKKSGIAKSVLGAEDDRKIVQVCGSDLSNIVKKAESSDHSEGVEARKTVSIAKLKAEIKLKTLSAQHSGDKDKKTDEAYTNLLKEVKELRGKLETFPVRNIPVYEHPPILDDALNTSNNRVLIVSPWITAAVVNGEFIRKIRTLLDRGVNLAIGYGIEENLKNYQPRHANSGERELQKLSASYDNFTFVELGDTHAKILIKDSEYYVVTSFNWLSFRGDPKRKFREEWGTMVSVRENVDEFFSEIIARFPTRQPA